MEMPEARPKRMRPEDEKMKDSTMKGTRELQKMKA